MLKELVLSLCLHIDYSLPSVEAVLNPPPPRIVIVPVVLPVPFQNLLLPNLMKPPELVLPKFNGPIKLDPNTPILRPLHR